MSSTKAWWKEGIRFECQSSGKCCTSHGEYGFVYLTKKDRVRMAKQLEMTLAAFTKKHCDRSDGFFHLKEDPQNTDCAFLKNKKCQIYEARPTQCRTWPFWPDTLPAKAWNKEVITFCPGVGKGSLISADKIQIQLQEQIDSETSLDDEAREFLQKKVSPIK